MKQQEHKSFEDNEDERLMVNVNPLEKVLFPKSEIVVMKHPWSLGGSNEDEEVYWWIKPFEKVLSWSEIASIKLAPKENLGGINCFHWAIFFIG